MSYLIGIDLGTTNSTLAFASSGSSEIFQLPIAQKMDRERLGENLTLPSFLYFPLQEEESLPFVGFYARERGHEVPDRVIGSAKSWLCHEGVDCRAPFLPLSDFEQKKSPVEVCAHLLSVLKSAWEQKVTDVSFKEQILFVTVPASFDPAARQLVQEAAQKAGFPDTILLEEPLAAFYAWLHRHEHNWRDLLKVGESILVVDIGGGTTDFSLICVEEREGELHLERKAVGNHLLLGGDNIDLTLAYLAKEKLGVEIDEWQFQSLVYACRHAKEKLLGEDPIEKTDVTILGRGSSLIGSTLTTTLFREEIENTLLQGFFPIVSIEEKPLIEKRSALAKVGLSFVRDPRITAHLAHFLKASKTQLPSAVLFNGGTMKADSFQKQIINQLSLWKGEEVRTLKGADLDYSVSQGAVYYAQTCQGKGIRVRAGTSRSYFIGIEGNAPAVPGIQPPLKAVCLVPFGLEEGMETQLEEEFTLFLEESALFRFFSCPTPSLSNQEIPQVGTIISKWTEELIEHHPIETVLNAQGDGGKAVLVKIKSKVTLLGLLELWCEAEDGRRWKLEFDLRKENSIAEASV